MSRVPHQYTNWKLDLITKRLLSHTFQILNHRRKGNTAWKLVGIYFLKISIKIVKICELFQIYTVIYLKLLRNRNIYINRIILNTIYNTASWNTFSLIKSTYFQLFTSRARNHSYVLNYCILNFHKYVQYRTRDQERNLHSPNCGRSHDQVHNHSWKHTGNSWV